MPGIWNYAREARSPMILNLPTGKDYWINLAKAEGDSEVGAGYPGVAVADPISTVIEQATVNRLVKAYDQHQAAINHHKTLQTLIGEALDVARARLAIARDRERADGPF
jgi:hypothetical protein